MKQTLLAAVIVFASVGTARAGGQPNSIGVGAELQVSGVGGLSVNYDAGKFHAGGFFGYFDPQGPNNVTVDVGGRFFFHVASTATSDFSLGGSIGIESANDAPGNPNRHTDVFIEPAFQIRAFIVPNVALSFTGGLVIGAADVSELDLTSNTSGRVTGMAGIHYYF
ncbi:MAG TPA: hypothetical protein VHW23_06720 [Kofleriaceae bacterium]|nr:hypothetical protein [Kofleriaceae bacterium]